MLRLAALIVALSAAAVAARQPSTRTPVSATLSGRVSNEREEPMKGVHIDLWRREGSRRFEDRIGPALTDANDLYRMAAVPPGDYVAVLHVGHDTRRQGPTSPRTSACQPAPPAPPGTVISSPPQPVPLPAPVRPEGTPYSELPRWIPDPGPDEHGTPRTYQTQFYPRASDLSRATVLQLGSNDERTGIDFQMTPIAATSARGKVTVRYGGHFGNASTAELLMQGAPDRISEARTWIQSDRTFAFLDIPPGRYVLKVQNLQRYSCDVLGVRGRPTRMTIDVPPGGAENIAISMTSPAPEAALRSSSDEQ